jgi:hypothetical protein
MPLFGVALLVALSFAHSADEARTVKHAIHPAQPQGIQAAQVSSLIGATNRSVAVGF